MTIKKIRESLNMTQDQFARYLGMNTNAYATLERRGPSSHGWRLAVAAMEFLQKRGWLGRFLQAYFLARGGK